MAGWKVISLFSGAGGLDYGFEAAGFKTCLATDLNRDACESIKTSRPTWRVEPRDVSSFSTADILSTAGVRRREVDVVIGGPPCQPFSKSGFWKRYGGERLADPRAAMLNAYMRVVEEAQPRVFLLENVRGIKFNDLDDGYTLLLRSIDDINRRTGTRYRPRIEILNAADYGVPQQRERFFLVAERDGAEFVFPRATHGQGEGLQPFRTAWDALAKVVPDKGEVLDVRGKWARLLPSIPEGSNYLWHTPRGGGQPIFGWRSRYWTFLLKLAKDKPSWTLQASPGPSCGPFHWKNRRLSLLEMCRLQTFPPDTHVVGSSTSARRQVGNAVPSLLAEVLAREIAVQFFGRSRYRKPPVLLPPERGQPPKPEACLPVPSEFDPLIGNPPAHPGVGRGKGALARRAAA